MSALIANVLDKTRRAAIRAALAVVDRTRPGLKCADRAVRAQTLLARLGVDVPITYAARTGAGGLEGHCWLGDAPAVDGSGWVVLRSADKEEPS